MYPTSKPEHLVALFPFHHIFSKPHDMSREFYTEDHRCSLRRRVLSLTLADVHAIETERSDLDVTR